MSFILYKVTFPNSKIYIGYTSKSMKKRKADHYYNATSYKKCRTPIMNAIKKFRPNEIWEILGQYKTLKEVHTAEIAAIALFNSTDLNIGYNISAGGAGIKHTPFTKAKIGEGSVLTNKKRFANPANVKKQSKALSAHWAKDDNKEKAAVKRGAKMFIVIDVASGVVIGEWLSQRKCARDLNVSPGWINNVLKGRRIGKRKYTFKYKEQE